MKKNILTTLVACILVAALAVGGTLAYMTASDNAVVNTFTFANDMVVDIYEKLSDAKKNIGQADVTGTPNDGGLVTGDDYKNALTYTNVTPGQKLTKMPRVAVQTTVDAYVFVKPIYVKNGAVVTAAEAKVTMGSIGWTAVEGEDGVYYQKITVPAENKPTNDIYNIETPVFEDVTIANDATPETIGQIKIAVSMVQAAGFDTAALAYVEAPEFVF